MHLNMPKDTIYFSFFSHGPGILSGGDIDHQFWRNFENIAEKSADLLDEIHN